MSATGRGAVYRPLATYYTPAGVAEAALEYLVPRAELHRGLRFLEPHVGSGAFLQALYHQRLVAPDGGNVLVEDLDPEAPGLHLPGAHEARLAPDTGDLVRTGFLAPTAWPGERPDVILGNPPFAVTPPPITCPACDGLGTRHRRRKDGTTTSRPCRACKAEGTVQPRPIAVAELHTRRALELTRRHVVFLLRIGMLGSAERRAFWAGPSPAPLRACVVLTPRCGFECACPRCGGTGCDTCHGAGRRPIGGGTDSSEYALFWFDLAYTGRPYVDWLTWRT